MNKRQRNKVSQAGNKVMTREQYAKKMLDLVDDETKEGIRKDIEGNSLTDTEVKKIIKCLNKKNADLGKIDGNVR